MPFLFYVNNFVQPAVVFDDFAIEQRKMKNQKTDCPMTNVWKISICKQQH